MYRYVKLLATGVLLALVVVPALTQQNIAPVNDLPNPYQPGVRNWATHPDGRAWGSTAGIDIGPKGEIWAIDRCGANTLRGIESDARCIRSIRRAAK